MSTITIAARADNDGAVTIPKEALKTLNLRPGDEVEISIGLKKDARAQQDRDYNSTLDALFEEVDNLTLEPQAPPADPLKAAWGAAVEAKYQRMGIKL